MLKVKKKTLTTELQNLQFVTFCWMLANDTFH